MIEPIDFLISDCNSEQCRGEARCFDLNGYSFRGWSMNYRYACRDCGQVRIIKERQLEELENMGKHHIVSLQI